MRNSFIAILVVIIGVFSVPSHAAQFLVSAYGGQALFSETYETAYTLGAKASFMSRGGISLDGAIGYFEAEGKDGAGDLKAVPIYAGLNYMIPVNSPIRPYAGAVLGLSQLSSQFDSPALTYGARAGLYFKVTPDMKLFGEVSKLIIDGGSENNIEPLNIVAGLSIAYGGKLENKSGKAKEFKRARPQPRGPRGPRGPRRRY